MTGTLIPLTPREFAERALVGTLLWQPGQIIDIAAWLEPEDFRTPANGAVFRHLRDAVAEACARVEWGTVPVGVPDGSARMPVATDAEDALRTVVDIADTLRDMRGDAAGWAEMDGEAERHTRADAVARYAADYPGLLQRLDARDRAEIDAVLPLASVNPYTVPGVDPVSVFGQISTSAEQGDRFLTAPFLHTLMATAPATSVAQPEAYGQMVLEASIRREVQQSGMRVARASETSTELAGLLAAVETAVNHLDAAQQRWDAVTSTRTPANVPGQSGTDWVRSGPQRVDPDTLNSRLDLLAAVPDEREIAAAEETVLAAVLVRPDMVPGLAQRLLPQDFADRQLGTAFRAAIDVYAGATVTGRRVDPVTVAWEQQRHAAQHGPGVPVERLLRIVDRGPVGDVVYATEVVMRGRLARLTADAAQAVQQAAQHPGLRPADVLHTTRLAYDAVRATAARMSGQPTAPVGPVGADTLPADPVDRPDDTAGRSRAQVIQLRERAVQLRATLAGERPAVRRPDTTVGHSRVEHHQDAEQTVDDEVEPDL